MAVCPVRFEFQCEKEKLTFSHNIPRSLVTADRQRSQTPQYADAFAAALQPIMQEREPACRAASSPQCGQCQSPTAKILLTPMSWLHVVPDPFVNVWANPACETKSRNQIQEMMMLLGSQDASGLLPCRVCGKTEKTMQCARCKGVAYCGKDHQKADWASHKKVCIPARSGTT
jgi:hypothetical protein